MSSKGLGSLAGYAMSESDGEEDDFHGKLSGNISGSDDEQSSHSQAPSRTYSPVIREEEPPAKKKAAGMSLFRTKANARSTRLIAAHISIFLNCLVVV